MSPNNESSKFFVYLQLHSTPKPMVNSFSQQLFNKFKQEQSS